MKRTHRFELMLSDAEREIVAASAAATGLTMAGFARQAMMIDQPVSARVKAHVVDRAAIAALSAIGTNLNQIAKIGNSSKTLNQQHLHALTVMFRRLGAIVSRIENPQNPASTTRGEP
ncbi:plasmid mobilization relaxosome protein MobC [Devosia sp.]|uniref:plasmid mobilization protein n=1 Tax=Devosia sp. TaxID=1871048 RepID=UPI0019FBA8C9|nr:plasmid mobilization relaxosome protein MobC [Devosia sp.]MBE0580156.1 plasmid mobilization relaxosome protein MobC [Devosia sp.]